MASVRPPANVSNPFDKHEPQRNAPRAGRPQWTDRYYTPYSDPPPSSIRKNIPSIDVNDPLFSGYNRDSHYSEMMEMWTMFQDHPLLRWSPESYIIGGDFLYGRWYLPAPIGITESFVLDPLAQTNQIMDMQWMEMVFFLLTIGYLRRMVKIPLWMKVSRKEFEQRPWMIWWNKMAFTRGYRGLVMSKLRKERMVVRRKDWLKWILPLYIIGSYAINTIDPFLFGNGITLGILGGIWGRYIMSRSYVSMAFCAATGYIIGEADPAVAMFQKLLGDSTDVLRNLKLDLSRYATRVAGKILGPNLSFFPDLQGYVDEWQERKAQRNPPRYYPYLPSSEDIAYREVLPNGTVKEYLKYGLDQYDPENPMGFIRGAKFDPTRPRPPERSWLKVWHENQVEKWKATQERERLEKTDHVDSATGQYLVPPSSHGKTWKMQVSLPDEQFPIMLDQEQDELIYRSIF